MKELQSKLAYLKQKLKKTPPDSFQRHALKREIRYISNRIFYLKGE